ncbi:hypothetical protein BY458DRAFT_531241 [Sporodiniella umbellata]|nr:hypothetical protein BY458DRAFT_531241 [Sporodiniella umbellata]
MEEAAASVPKPTVDVKREPRKTKKSKKRAPSPPVLVSATLESETKKAKKKPSIKSSTVTTEELLERKQKQPKFKYTNFPVRGYQILPTRNITSHFGKNDASFNLGSKAGSEDLLPQADKEHGDIIVIHPGSRNLRIGFASEAFPVCIPHVIARRHRQPSEFKPTDPTLPSDALEEIKGELKWRMKNAKRRAVPNAESQITGFNLNAPQETILDHNDPYKVEWTEPQGKDHFVGQKALWFPINTSSGYRLFYPWSCGALNIEQNSIQAVLGDLQAIWGSVITDDLQVEPTEYQDYNVMLVVPDLFDNEQLCAVIRMLLVDMGFRAVTVQQESGCATYGAGVSTAVVVDVGAQRTNITCIEDGVCQVDSRLSIAMGGDDVTRTFASLLKSNEFPYQQMNLALSFDWRLAEELKEKWCTMNEAEVSIQVYDFFVRTPFTTTTKYQCKVYEEVFLAPLCLLYPNVLPHKRMDWPHREAGDDTLPVKNKVQGYPLDTAIAESIQIASNGSEEKLKRYFTSIILVGGGGKIVNFSKLLEDRVLSTLVAQQSFIERVEVLPAPRELDPEVIVWKGATVMSKLEAAKEMWIGKKEWLEMGARCLKERAILF